MGRKRAVPGIDGKGITRVIIMRRSALIVVLSLLVGAAITISCSRCECDEVENLSLARPSPTEEPIGESILSKTENAYNPIPSPDGRLIAFVRTGWGRSGGSGGFGRSNLISEVAVMDRQGNLITDNAICDGFLQGWSSDGSKVICSRDWTYSIVERDGTVLVHRQMPHSDIPVEHSVMSEVSESVGYLSGTESVIWLQNNITILKVTSTGPGASSISSDWAGSEIVFSNREAIRDKPHYDLNSFIVPSPNERYLALIGRDHLRIYDLLNRRWADLGKIVIHPDSDWDYIKPTWDPWFADSSKLVFATSDGIVTSNPDGTSKDILTKPLSPYGLPVPSPDGKLVAFVTFASRPMQGRPDLKFWGGTTIWVAPTVPHSIAHAITTKDQDTTIDLRWIDNRNIVFDRIADEEFYEKARLWKVTIPANP
jgi:hypothetical protein